MGGRQGAIGQMSSTRATRNTHDAADSLSLCHDQLTNDSKSLLDKCSRCNGPEDSSEHAGDQFCAASACRRQQGCRGELLCQQWTATASRRSCLFVRSVGCFEVRDAVGSWGLGSLPWVTSFTSIVPHRQRSRTQIILIEEFYNLIPCPVFFSRREVSLGCA